MHKFCPKTIKSLFGYLASFLFLGVLATLYHKMIDPYTPVFAFRTFAFFTIGGLFGVAILAVYHKVGEL